MFHSVDWGMPEGTPIVAARDGIVAEVESRYSLPGGQEMRDRANFVVIVNSDGSVTDYVHLRCGGVTVEPGQRVRAGEVIGYSGNTGWSTGPHLHFRVLRPVDGFRHESLPIRFHTAEGGNKVLQKGETWTATPLPENAPGRGEK
jgi:murein DD-endopeptidase MepM/ murein hydrolase activator NlpD